MASRARFGARRNMHSKSRTVRIVYFWGVLHHTGAMWRALENVIPLSERKAVSSESIVGFLDLRRPAPGARWHYTSVEGVRHRALCQVQSCYAPNSAHG